MLDVRLRNKKNGVALGMITRSHCADFPPNKEETTICNPGNKNPPTNTAPKREGNTDSSLIEQEEAADASPGSVSGGTAVRIFSGFLIAVGSAAVPGRSTKKLRSKSLPLGLFPEAFAPILPWPGSNAEDTKPAKPDHTEEQGTETERN